MRKGVWIGVGFLAGYWAAANVDNAKRAVFRGHASELHDGERCKRTRHNPVADLQPGHRQRGDRQAGGAHRPGVISHGFVGGYLVIVAVIGWWLSLLSLDWLSDITGIISDVGQDIINYVVSVATSLWSDINTVIDGVVDSVTSLAETVDGWIDDVEGAVDTVAQYIGDAGGALESIVSTWWDEWIYPYIEDVENAVGYVEGEISLYISGWWDGIYAAYIAPALDELSALWTWFGNIGGDLLGYLNDWWSSIFSAVISPLIQGWNDVYNSVANLLTWAENEAYAAVDMVIKATDWLIWFGEHTFDDLEAWFTDLPGAIEAWGIAGATGAQDEYIDDLSSIFAEVLG